MVRSIPIPPTSIGIGRRSSLGPVSRGQWEAISYVTQFGENGGTLAKGLPTVVAGISPDVKPRWLRDLARFLPLKSQFVLSGNVFDLQTYEESRGDDQHGPSAGGGGAGTVFSRIR